MTDRIKLLFYPIPEHALHSGGSWEHPVGNKVGNEMDQGSAAVPD